MLKRHGLKKGLSLVLVFCLILSLMPTVALAQEPTASTGTETTEGVTGTEGGSTGTGDTTGAEGGSAGTGDTTGAEGGSTGTGDTTGTEGGSTGTGDTTGTEGGSTETGNTAGTETGNAAETETGGTTGAEDETEKDDPLDDFLDDILNPLPGDTGAESGNGNETTQPDDGETPNIPTEDVNGEKPEAPEGTVTPDPNPQDPSTAPSDDFPTILPVFPSEEDPAEVLPPEELLPEVPEDTTVTAEVTTEENEPITITVTGPGLTGLTVEAVPSVTTLPVEPTQEQVDYVAYDVTPMVDDVPYTEPADVTIPVPADWAEDAEIYGFVVNGEDAEEPVTVIEGVRSEDGTFTFTAPHFSVMGLYAEPQPLYTEQQDVNVNVGQSTSYTVEGDLTGQVTGDPDDSIAKVEVTNKKIPSGTTAKKVNALTSGNSYYISDGNGNYLTLSGDTLTNANLDGATQWTYDNGCLSAGGYYLTYTKWGPFPDGLAVSRSDKTEWSYDGDKFYYSGRVSNYPITYNDGWRLNIGSTAGAYEKVTTEESEVTVITITGVGEGVTSVIVGDIKYNITVTDLAPEDAFQGDTLTVEYWITNSKVYKGEQDRSPSSVTIFKGDASDPAGVEIASIVPDPAYSYYDGKVEVHFWQAMRLDYDHHQGTGGVTDQTGNGTAFTRVRFDTDKGAWQYYGQDEVWHWFLNGDQAVAYYMQHTEITQEITTAMKDWGYTTEKNTPANNGDGQVALSVAVVYEDMSLSPKEGEIYDKSTIIFNYWNDYNNGHNGPRDIGLIAPLNNSDYEIERITVTNGYRVDNNYLDYWKPDDTITWDKVETEGGSEWFNETEYWNAEEDGGVPMLNGASMGITWSGKNTAKLILIYIKPIKKETNLNVVWWDDSGNNKISDTQIVVSGDGNETFFNSLVQQSEVPQAGGEFTLDDDAYVLNSSGVRQPFNKDLTIMNIAAQYRSGLYKYVKADLSADGKTLTLHYQIDSSKLAHQYVVDFGLPVNVPLSDLVEKEETVESVSITGTDLATVEGDKSITFQPDEVMNAVMVVTAKLTFTDRTTQDIKIGFVPASTVYYEEGFMTFDDGFTGGSKGEKRQETSKLGAGTVYGYDAAYASETGPSNNSEATSNTAGSTATFSFKGTGVDIYANCSSDTGVVMIKVYEGSKLIKLLTVDTAMVDGVTDATKGQAVTAYNIPIASIDGLDYGTYDVEIVHVARKAGETSTDPVYLDGFRVHQPLGISEGNKFYGDDTEAGAEISELRDAALHIVLSGVDSSKSEYAKQLANAKAQVYAKTGGQGASAVVLSYAMGAEEKVVIDILDNGPKNEIYLRQNETLVFEVDSSAENVQVGLKKLHGDSVTCTVNSKEHTVYSTDMFYKVETSDGYVTIQNTGTGILAVTELKVASGN